MSRFRQNATALRSGRPASQRCTDPDGDLGFFAWPVPLEVGDAQENLAGLRRMPALTTQDVGQRHPAVEDGPEIAPVHQDHRRTQAGVIADAGLREAVDRDEEPERVFELATDLAVECVERGRLDELLLPARLEKVVDAVEGEGPRRFARRRS
jgi:hypothetical protein